MAPRSGLYVWHLDERIASRTVAGADVWHLEEREEAERALMPQGLLEFDREEPAPRESVEATEAQRRFAAEVEALRQAARAKAPHREAPQRSGTAALQRGGAEVPQRRGLAEAPQPVGAGRQAAGRAAQPEDVEALRAELARMRAVIEAKELAEEEQACQHKRVVELLKKTKTEKNRLSSEAKTLRKVMLRAEQRCREAEAAQGAAEEALDEMLASCQTAAEPSNVDDPASSAEGPARPSRPERRRCVICMAMPQEVAVDPCGHVSMCHMCAGSSKMKACPICRGPMKKILRVYLA